MSAVIGRLRWSVRQRGVGGTLRAAANWLRRRMVREEPAAPHPFDVEHGTDTGGLIAGGELASGHASDAHIAGYAAVPPSRFRGMIARWQASGIGYDVSEYCFVDVGCGKGRALLLASEMGFREVVGVELNPALAVIAEANAEIWRAAGKARARIRVVQEDATEFRWPPGPCVVFLFNPFDAVVMQRLVERMVKEFQERPSELEILYYKPEQADAFATDFEMVWCEAIAMSEDDVAVDPVADVKDETIAYRLREKGVLG